MVSPVNAEKRVLVRIPVLTLALMNFVVFYVKVPGIYVISVSEGESADYAFLI